MSMSWRRIFDSRQLWIFESIVQHIAPVFIVLVLNETSGVCCTTEKRILQDRHFLERAPFTVVPAFLRVLQNYMEES